MKLEVPYYSQYKDVVNEEWRPKACAMTCLKMALDFLVPARAPSIDVLMHEALVHTNSMISVGLITPVVSAQGLHRDVTVAMAHNYGVNAYREEFKSMSLDEKNNSIASIYENEVYDNGIKKIVAMLETGSLPLVSVLPGLSEGKAFHTILFIGFEEENGTLRGFYYHDSDAKEEPRKAMYMSFDEFNTYWRKMVIFIG